MDLRHSVRKLAHTPGFTLLAMLALAIGIAANTSIFTVVNAVLLRPLPFHEPDRLAYIWEVSPRSGNLTNVVNPGNFHEWRDRNRSFGRLAAWVGSQVNLTGEGEPEQVNSAYVTEDFFTILGLAPQLGRDFTHEEMTPNGPDAVIISDGLWKRRFGADRGVVGKRIQVDSKATTIVGVAPPVMRYPRQVELWSPIAPKRTWRGRFLTAIARLRPGVSMEAAQSEMDSIMAQLRTEHPEFNDKWRVNVMPMARYETKDVRVALLVLLGAVGFVLLIACANVANLMLVRATARLRELAVRASVGAGRWDLARPMLVESMVLSCSAGALGLIFSFWLTDLLLALTPESLALQQAASGRLDPRVLLFTMGASLATGFLFGIVPAIRAARIDLVESLKGTRVAGGSLRTNRFRAALVVGEVALSLMLLIGAGLLGRSFLQLLSVAPGFEPGHTLTLNISIFNRKGQQASQFLEALLDRVRRVPGVLAAGSAHFLPMSGLLSATGFRVDGQPIPAPGDMPVCEVSVITSGYFAAMGIPLLQGRTFDGRDTAGTPPVLIIDQVTAQRYFTNVNPIGKRLFVQWGHDGVPYEIIGVVGGIRSSALDNDPKPTVYIPNAQEPLTGAHLVIRTSGDPLQIAGAVKQMIREVDPAIPVSGMRSLDYYVSSSVAKQRFNTILLGIFASMALLLAVIGVFGVISYAVSQRTQEIGIRMALGARGAEVTRLIVGEGMALAAAGIALGIAGALLLTRYLASLLFGVKPTDIPTFAGVSALLASAAFLAAWLPARRAARVDPMIALRHE